MLSGVHADVSSCVPQAAEAWVSQSARAAITKYHRWGGLNNRCLFLTVWEAKKSKIKVPANSVLSESSLPGLWMAAFSLGSHMAEKERETETEGEHSLISLPLLIKTLNPTMGTPASQTHLSTSQRPHLQISSHWGLGLQHES